MILLAGGAGYIASHTGVALALAGIPYVVLDNFCNSVPAVLERMHEVGGLKPTLVQGDVRDAATLDALFARYPIQGVIHFAGLKAVGESVAEPALYYENNVSGSVTLIRAMQRAGVKTMVFSSSATVYGNSDASPLQESAPLVPINPYGQSKLMVESILRDVAAANPDWRVACLRYFNPVGAHISGLLGEDPRGEPGNLMPFIGQVAVGRRPQLSVFGNDYPTPDGTGVRDYIHVMDLARGHLAAVRRVLQAGPPTQERYRVLNLGRGQGLSELQLLQAFEQHTGHPMPHQWAPRRAGDAACWMADVTAARQHLGWQAELGPAEMCIDAWRWQGRA